MNKEDIQKTKDVEDWVFNAFYKNILFHLFKKINWHLSLLALPSFHKLYFLR